MKTRTNKFRGKRIWLVLIKLIKEIVKSIYYILVGLIYLILKTYVEFEKAFLKLWGMFPRWFKRLAIWLMLINIHNLNSQEPITIEKLITTTETKEVFVLQETYIEKEKCSYGLYECAVYDEAIEQGMTEEQSKVAIAISKHETGSYTSPLFKNANNIGGLYNSNTKKFYTYKTLDDGIEAYVRNLKKGYFDKGLDTIEKIQKKYAPINADNDPTGLNNNWVSGVTYFYNELV